MARPHQVELSLTECGPGSEVQVDDLVIRNLRAVSVSRAWDDVTEVTVTFRANVNWRPEGLEIQ